jgi:ABC-2 type transport system permease protein
VWAIQWRTSWRQVVGWVAGLTAVLAGTIFSLDHTYDTPAKIHEYAQAVRSGDALVAINGRVAGLDSLGGVIANEFGFVAAFALPLMGISLVARQTRREEESGRLDLVSAGRVGRASPVAAASMLALAAVAVTTAAFAACLGAVGIPVDDAMLYAVSLGGLALCFAAVAAVAAQVVPRSRGVYAVGLGVLAAAYLVRGVGDISHSWLSWLSPLGWAEQTRAFGDARWWPLVVPAIAGALGLVAAVVMASRRDVGSAWVSGGRGPATASGWLLRPGGLALRLGRGPVAAWAVGAAVVTGMFGALTRQAADAIAGNLAVQEALGGSAMSGSDVLVQLDLVLLCLMTAAFAIQWVGTMRDEEVQERLEVTLSGTTTRRRWLGAQAGALLVGLVAVAGAGAASLALTTAWSLDDAGQVGRLLGAAAAYLPAVLVLGAAALLLYGVRPQWLGLAWAWLAVTATVALLGDALGLPGWVRAVAPTERVGDLPAGSADWTGLVALTVAAAAQTTLAARTFRRRDIPQR